jgi:putative restriction endonuclease
LKNQVDENAFQEEVFIRGGLFKREIPKIYNNTCAITGLRIDAITNIVDILFANIEKKLLEKDITVIGFSINPSEEEINRLLEIRYNFFQM